jgi:hypothetical protein
MVVLTACLGEENRGNRMEIKYLKINNFFFFFSFPHLGSLIGGKGFYSFP